MILVSESAGKAVVSCQCDDGWSVDLTRDQIQTEY